MIQEPTKRKVKEAVVKLLKEGKTLAGENISLSRSIPSEDVSFPLVNVYSISESVERFDEAPKRYRRRLTVLIECLSRGDEDSELDLELERLAYQIELLMERDETLGGLLNKLELTSSDYQQEPDGASPIALLALRYSLEYFDELQGGDEYLVDFLGVDAEWNAASGDERPDEYLKAQDTINLDQGE